MPPENSNLIDMMFTGEWGSYMLHAPFIIQSEDRARDLIEALDKVTTIGLDFETASPIGKEIKKSGRKGPNGRLDSIIGFSIYLGPDYFYGSISPEVEKEIVDSGFSKDQRLRKRILKWCKEGRYIISKHRYFPALPIEWQRKVLEKALKGKIVVHHYGVFDIQCCTQLLGTECIYWPKKWWDTLLAAKAIDQTRKGGNGLKNLSTSELKETHDYHLIIESSIDAETKHPLPIADYCIRDSCNSYRLHSIFRHSLHERNELVVFENLTLEVHRIANRMTATGIRVDRDILSDKTAKARQKESELRKELDEEMRGLNPASPDQLGKFLFGVLGLTLYLPRKDTGKYDLSAEHLEMLADHHPIVQKILEWRTWFKLLSSFLTPIENYTKKSDILHPVLDAGGTVSGRLSSRDPNGQNLPAKRNDPIGIREIFIPREGCIFLDHDYSQLEMRILAHMSGDPGMIKAFKDNLDPHILTALEAGMIKNEYTNYVNEYVLAKREGREMNIPKDILSELKIARDMGKTLVYAMTYGMSPIGLAKRWNKPVEEAQQTINNYFEAKQRVKDLKQSASEQILSTGKVKTLLGRARIVEGWNSRDKVSREAALRSGFNTIIQGTGSDIINCAMIRIENDNILRNSLKCIMLLQIHDELLSEVPEDNADEANKRVVEFMENSLNGPLLVPILVEGGPTTRWSK